MLQNCVCTVLNGAEGEGFASVLSTLTLYVQLRMNDDCVYRKCRLGSSSLLSFICKSVHIIYTYTFTFQKWKRVKVADITVLFMLNTN